MASKRKRRVRRWIVALLCVLLLVFGGHRLLCAWYPLSYEAEVEAATEKYGLSPSLVYAVIHTESGFDPAARSSAGAVGLMQVTAPTMEWALMRSGVSDAPDEMKLTDPAFNIEIGTCVLYLLGEQFSEQDTVLASYNAGMGHVQTWLGDAAYSDDGKTLHTIPFEETRNYVTKVRRAQKIYQKLYGLP